MRVLVLLSRVATPAELERSSVDSTWLIDLERNHDLLVAVDENSAGCALLRDAGVTVHVSDKRHVYLTGGRLVDADVALAGWVRSQHEAEPFDLVMAGSDRPAFGSVRAALPGVPWAVIAGSGPTAHSQRLTFDSEWLRPFGHELWRAASNVSAADLVISPVPLHLLGIDVGDTPVFALTQRPDPDLHDRVFGELIVVVATGVSVPRAPEVVEQALAVTKVDDATTIVVVHTPPIVGATDVAPALSAGIPTELQQQVVLVPADTSGQAGVWVEMADALVLADASELLIPHVARRSVAVPTVVLRHATTHRAIETVPVLATPATSPRGDVQLVPWTNPARVANELRTLRRSAGPDMVIIHDAESALEASRWLTTDPLARFDVVVAATPIPPWSMPHLRRLRGGLIALHRRTWSVAAEDLDRLGSLPAFVAHASGLAGAASHTIGAIVVDGASDVQAPTNAMRSLDLVGGPLPRIRPPAVVPTAAPQATARPRPTPKPAAAAPRRSPAPAEQPLRSWVRTARWHERAQLARPWRLGLSDAVRSGDLPPGVAAWARSHRLPDRLRLLLPWRGGLLGRAMKDRW